MKVRWLQGISIQAVGRTGPFHLEVQWIRAFRQDARIDIENENEDFIQDIDALGIYERDILKMELIQQQYFQQEFPDPFRFEDDGVFDRKTYVGMSHIIFTVFYTFNFNLFFLFFFSF